MVLIEMFKIFLLATLVSFSDINHILADDVISGIITEAQAEVDRMSSENAIGLDEAQAIPGHSRRGITKE